MIVVSRSPGYVNRFHFRRAVKPDCNLSSDWRLPSVRERAGAGSARGAVFPAPGLSGRSPTVRSRTSRYFPPAVRPMNRALARRPHGYLARPDAPAMVAVHPVLHDSRVPTHTSVAASPRQGTPRRTADLCCPHATSLKECTALLRLSRYPLMPMALSCLMHGHHGP